MGGLIWPVTRDGGVELSQYLPFSACGGTSCETSPGQGTSNQVILYVDISLVACNKGLLLPEPYKFLMVSVCWSHGDVSQKLFLVAELWCYTVWAPSSVLLLLRTNWVHEDFFCLFFVSGSSLDKCCLYCKHVTNIPAFVISEHWRAPGPLSSTCGFFVLSASLFFSFSSLFLSPCSLFRYLLTMNGMSLQVERSSPPTTLQH